jgi:hypothetical protein
MSSPTVSNMADAKRVMASPPPPTSSFAVHNEATNPAGDPEARTASRSSISKGAAREPNNDSKPLSPRDITRLPRNQFSRLVSTRKTRAHAPESLNRKGQRLANTTERAIRMVGPIINRLADLGEHEPERGVRSTELGNLNWLVKEVLASPVLSDTTRDRILNTVVDVLEPFIAYLDKHNYGPLAPCEMGILKLQQRLARITYVEELDAFRAQEIAATKEAAKEAALDSTELDAARLPSVHSECSESSSGMKNRSPIRLSDTESSSEAKSPSSMSLRLPSEQAPSDEVANLTT